jgi:hypothetical protein
MNLHFIQRSGSYLTENTVLLPLERTTAVWKGIGFYCNNHKEDIIKLCEQNADISVLEQRM